MTDMEYYEKLRGELRKIFLEGDNLMDEDEFLFDFFSDSLDSKKVLEIAKEMKEEGNSLFKLGKFEDALEKYGNAEIILVGHKFEEKVDRTEFCDLSLCILLNSSACFSKLKEFERVGQVCSIILDFQPNNVKAMYRRAMAAVELGRLEWAYLDLVLAAEISPSNQEVVKRLEEVKSSIRRKKSNDQTQGHCPTGLGLGLPPHKKKSDECLTEEKTISHKEIQEKDPFIVEKEGGGDHFVRMSKEEESRSSSNLEIINSDICQKVSEEEKKTDEIKDERMEDAGKRHSASDFPSSITDDVDMISSVCNDEVINPLNLEEPIYRFHNRKNQGSKLSISKSNYLLMSQGKSLKFYNAKLGSYMEVRIVNKLEEKAADTSGYHIQEKASPLHCGNQSHLAKVQQENTDSEEVHSEVGSCVTFKDNQPEDCDDASSGARMLCHFNFSTISNSKARKKSYNIKCHDSSRVPVKNTKRRKLQIDRNVSFFHTNFDCECRFEVGMKRKYAHLLPLDFYHHPRKKIAPLVCLKNQCISCPRYCTNICNAGNTSIKDVGKTLVHNGHVLAMSARKGL